MHNFKWPKFMEYLLEGFEQFSVHRFNERIKSLPRVLKEFFRTVNAKPWYFRLYEKFDAYLEDLAAPNGKTSEAGVRKRNALVVGIEVIVFVVCFAVFSAITMNIIVAGSFAAIAVLSTFVMWTVFDAMR